MEESHNEDRATEEDDEDLLDEDARLNKEKYDVVLVYASPLELHAQFHEVDLMISKVEEMKEKMTELMIQDTTLEPATIIDKVLNDFTETKDGQEKSELIAYSIVLEESPTSGDLDVSKKMSGVRCPHLNKSFIQN